MDTITKKVSDFYNKWPFPQITDKRLSELENIQAFPQPKYKNALSVGCGTLQPAGLMKENLAENYTFVDISAASVEIAKTLVSQPATWICDDILSTNLMEKYDVIMCTNVLHHLPDPEKVLVKLREVASNDCTLIISVYNAESWLRQSIEPIIDYTKHCFDSYPEVLGYLESFPQETAVGLWMTLYEKTPDQILDTWMHPFHKLIDNIELDFMLLEAGWQPSTHEFCPVGTHRYLHARPILENT